MNTLPNCGDNIHSKLEHVTVTGTCGNSKSENADNEGISELESESEIGEDSEVPSGMENEDFGPEEPLEDNKFNVDDDVDINSLKLLKIIGLIQTRLESHTHCNSQLQQHQNHRFTSTTFCQHLI